MNEISSQQLLEQIRSLNADLQNPGRTSADEVNSAGFGDVLKNTVSQVNSIQAEAGNMKRSFETGGGDATLAEVMIASQKADLSFRAMTEVRNKLVTAYQEIMNMPV